MQVRLTWGCPADEVIPGLDLAVQEMKLAEEALITLQPQYAYGEAGYKGPLADVPPNTPVTFRVHLVSFDKVRPPQRLGLACCGEGSSLRRWPGHGHHAAVSRRRAAVHLQGPPAQL